MRQFVIDGKTVAEDTPAYVIAEIGHNHAHDMDKTFAMMKSAVACGASALKFQTRHPKEVYQNNSKRGAYHFKSDNPQWLDPVYGVHREKLELTWDEWVAISDMARSLGVTFFSTPFDFKSLDLLERLGVPAYKVASGDATNIPLIQEIARTQKPTIISTGGCSQEDVDRLCEAFERINANEKHLAILQCSCVYPAPDDAMNLNVIPTFMGRYPDTVIGLSTHNSTTTPSIAAFALGARIFEHHYTNDRAWKGTDNKFSLTPPMLRQFVIELEQVHKALGHNVKFCSPVEKEPTIERRKSLVWARNILETQFITRDDVKIQCPGDGIPPYYLDRIVGMQTAYNVGEGELVRWQDILVTKENYAQFQEMASA